MALAVSILGSVVGAVGAIAQANAAQSAANYNAKVAERNATIARNNAAVEAQAKARETKAVMGRTIAATAASGLQMEGSPLEVLSENARVGELDRLMILYNGQNAEYGYRADATLNRLQGKAAATTGFFNAAGSLLGGVGSALKLM